MDEQMKSAQKPDHPIDGLLTTTLAKLKEMVDVDVIVGKPIDTPDGTTLIPVSRLSMGFASGGSDFAGKTTRTLPPITSAAAPARGSRSIRWPSSSSRTARCGSFPSASPPSPPQAARWKWCPSWWTRSSTI